LKLSWDEIKDRLKICEEKCKHFLKHEHEYRKNQLKQRLDVTRAKNNREAERTILETIQRERELAMWKRLQNAIGPPLKTKQYTIRRRRNAPPINAPECA
jgi:hypothetical protein